MGTTVAQAYVQSCRQLQELKENNHALSGAVRRRANLRVRRCSTLVSR